MAFLVVGAVQLVGFTQGGIAAGSLAASMMSAAGPVAAGSLVAVCQSIGATGAVSFVTAAIANTAFGAALGGAAYAAYRKFLHGEKLNKDEAKAMAEGFRNYVMI
ncbi:uncharacterized protein [Apostichopus japonicus]|uniref:uncharacterized protein n=1 Tax=Stichopus japonicus TaxID=307972 RepID=UPI003AB3034D